MQRVLQAAGIIAIIISVIWWIVEPSFDPLYAFVTGLVALLSSFIIPKQEDQTESLDQHNRRVMLNHVENFWVKCILEKSLHGVALLELGVKEDPTAIAYPWAIKKEKTNETLPSGKSMLEIFEEIGASRSLLILGAPGSGKTTMLLELARQLIERARNDETEPIPVVFNLASWTKKQTLTDWLAEQLNIIYYVQKKTGAKWVSENKMLLLLDGLDEVKQESREKCVEAINQFRNKHGLTSLVVCSRIEEYQAINTKLFLEGAIVLQPLTSTQVNVYFDRFGRSLAGVKQLLKKDKALRELAETPLMLSIMILTYKDKNPKELPASNNLEEQRRHLFNAYVNRMFERPTRSVNTLFTKSQTLHYLSWLARKMIEYNVVIYQIETLQPSWLGDDKNQRLYKVTVRLIVGLIVGLVFGLFLWLISGLIGGLIFGTAIGLIGGLSGRLIFLNSGRLGGEIQMVDRLRLSWKGFLAGLIIGLIGGTILGLIVGLVIWLTDRPSYGLVDWLMEGRRSGLLFGTLLGLIGGFESEQIKETKTPKQRINQTLFNAIFSALAGSLVGWLGGWLIGDLTLALGFGMIIGLAMGMGFGFSALAQHYILRYMLIKIDFIPRSLVSFLEYAIDLIFLRRVGGSYIFVHRLLMEHFAEMKVEKP